MDWLDFIKYIASLKKKMYLLNKYLWKKNILKHFNKSCVSSKFYIQTFYSTLLYFYVRNKYNYFLIFFIHQ